MINIIISLLTITLFLTIIIQSVIFKKRNIESSGTPPIKQKFFKIGKLSLIISWILIIIQALLYNLRIIQISIYIEYISLSIVFFGLVFVIASFYTLGDANKVGLPIEKTVLKTKGIYKISRNPMYVGFLLFSVASCTYTINPIAFILAIIAIFIHHKIVYSEEEFLKKRFGSEYIDYLDKVRRYI